MTKSSNTATAEIREIEMRTAPRYPILQRCFVFPASAPTPEPWRGVAYNISTAGIGVAVPIRLDEGTILTIQAWEMPNACPLRVRIVTTKQVDFLWFNGCELVKRLSDAELRIWRSGPLDWLEGHK